MAIFGLRKSVDWHQQIDVAANGQHPATPEGEFNPFFPWDQLEQVTIQYIKKKGKLAREERDRRLLDLVRHHGAKDIAIAACALLMSPKVVKDYVLLELSVDPDREDELHMFLQIILAAHHQCPDAIEKQEAQRAQWLIPFCARNTSATASSFRLLLTLLADIIPTYSSLHHYTEALTSRSCIVFVRCLEIMKLESLWLRANDATEWLSTLSSVSLELSSGSLHLLHTLFPDWRIWATWRPSMARLQMWERFNGAQRMILRDLLALEGPDFTGTGKPTLREGLIGQIQPAGSRFRIDRDNMHLELMNSDSDKVRQMLDRLSSAVDAACNAGSAGINLLAHLCVGTIIDHEGLHILEMVNTIGDSSVTAAILEVYTTRSETRNAQIAAIMQLLPKLGSDHFRELREALTPSLLISISNCIEEMQGNLRNRLLNQDVSDGTEEELQTFGDRVKNTPWIRPSLKANINLLLDSWPSKENIDTFRDLRLTALSMPFDGSVSLVDILNAYCVDILIERGTMEESPKQLVEVLLDYWCNVVDFDRRTIAIILAGASISSFDYTVRLLLQLPTLPDDFVCSLKGVVHYYYFDIYKDLACVNFARLLVSTSIPNAISTWKPVLDRLISDRGESLLSHTSQNLDLDDWIEWLGDLRLIYGDISTQLPGSSSPALWSRLIQWAARLGEYSPVIQQLQSSLGPGNWTGCIKTGGNDALLEDFVIKILALLKDHRGTQYQRVLSSAVSMLNADGGNVALIYEMSSLVVFTTPAGTNGCIRVLDLHSQASPQVAEAILAGLLQSAEMSRADASALKALGQMLGVYLDSHGNMPEASLEAAATYLNTQFALLLAKARHLEDLRTAFKAADPDGTAAMLKTIGVEDTTPAQDALSNLPAALINLVEIVNHEEIEMQIPLTHLTALQRVALGVNGANNLLVRLNLPESSHPLAFCLHLDDDPKSDDGDHRPWMVSEGNRAPVVPVCHGNPNRTKFQLARILFRYLKKGYTSLEDIHELLVTNLKTMASHCIVCGSHLESPLRRSTCCLADDCEKIFARSHLAVKLSDIRHDGPALDALLAGVYAAALSGRPELLPKCPVTNLQTVIQILNMLPAVTQLQAAPELSVALRRSSLSPKQTEQLLSWAANNYRGFLTSATGQLRIPGMVGAHQFVLANHTPELESSFAKTVALHGGNTRVMFHGTALDRLFAILTQGLQVKSGTQLQRTGAYYGNGIYLADNPQTAWSYATTTSSISTWPSSQFKNVRVLLGCELTGSGTEVPGGIHVITNPSQVMVRYVFLMPPSAAVPTLATHVTPAMASVFSFLRSAAP